MNKLLRITINMITMVMTTFLVAYELTAIAEHPALKAGLFVIAVTIELIAQCILALGLAYFRLDGVLNKLKGCALLSYFCWYVIVFAVFAGVGFFVTELNTTATVTETVETEKNITVSRVKQIDETLTILNRQLRNESITGYGPQSEKIMDQISQLSAEQKRLTASMVSAVSRTSKSLFKGLAEVFGLSENIFKIIVFGTMVMTLYLGLMLTAWRFKIDVTSVIPKVSIPEEPEPVVSVSFTKPVAASVSSDTTKVVKLAAAPPKAENTCKVCGAEIQGKKGKLYCSDKCRLAAFRMKSTAEGEGGHAAHAH